MSTPLREYTARLSARTAAHERWVRAGRPSESEPPRHRGRDCPSGLARIFPRTVTVVDRVANRHVPGVGDMARPGHPSARLERPQRGVLLARNRTDRGALGRRRRTGTSLSGGCSPLRPGFASLRERDCCSSSSPRRERAPAKTRWQRGSRLRREPMKSGTATARSTNCDYAWTSEKPSRSSEPPCETWTRARWPRGRPLRRFSDTLGREPSRSCSPPVRSGRRSGGF